MHNYQAECELLGSILIDNELIKETSITTEHFFDFNNKQLFGYISKFFKMVIQLQLLR
jgi:replicative DNA helicase